MTDKLSQHSEHPLYQSRLMHLEQQSRKDYCGLFYAVISLDNRLQLDCILQTSVPGTRILNIVDVFFSTVPPTPPDQDGRHQFTLQDPELEATDPRNKGSACGTLSGALQAHAEGRRHFEVRLLTVWV